MYGFHKVPHIQSGALKHDESAAELLEFSNPNFARAQPDLLCLIRRQKAKGEPAEGQPGALDLPVLLTDLAAIQKHQKAISADLKDLQVSNHALWQEALASREKHSKQQETINKILRFLATVFGGQVVNADEGESPAASVVEESSRAGSAGPQQVGGQGGKGKGRSVAVVPKVRSRLLLEDVKGRQASRGLDGSPRIEEEDDPEDDDDEIEEIPLLGDDHDDLPTISSGKLLHAPETAHTHYGGPDASPPYATATQYTGRGAITRNPSNPTFSYPTISSPSKSPAPSSDSSRFTTLPTTTSTPLPADPTTASASFQVQPDMVQSLLHPGNQNSLQAFLSMQGSNDTPGVGSFPNLMGSSGAMAPPTAAPTSISLPDPMTAAFMGMGAGGDYSRAMVPSPMPAYTPAAPVPSSLASLLPTTSAPADPIAELNLSNQLLQNVAQEKIDIDARTSALEAAIAKLMQNLPEGTRETLQAGGQVGPLSPGPLTPGLSGLAGLATPGPSGTSEGMQWPTQGLGAGPDDVDLDKFLAQYTNNGGTGASPAPSTSEPVDYSSWFDQGAAGLSPAPNGVGMADGEGSRGASEDLFDEDDVLEAPVWETGGDVAQSGTPTRGKKRKSDAGPGLGGAGGSDEGEAESPEGTRKSARRKKK